MLLLLRLQMLSEQKSCGRRPCLHQACKDAADPSWDAACSSMRPCPASWSTIGSTSLQLSSSSKLQPSGSWGTWTGMLKQACRQPVTLKGDLPLLPSGLLQTVSSLWREECQGRRGWALCRTEQQPLTAATSQRGSTCTHLAIQSFVARLQGRSLQARHSSPGTNGWLGRPPSGACSNPSKPTSAATC